MMVSAREQTLESECQREPNDGGLAPNSECKRIKGKTVNTNGQHPEVEYRQATEDENHKVDAGG